MTVASFERLYFDKQSNGNHFWVAEDAELNVIGCVGLKRPSPDSDSIELVRMAVREDMRGKGVGAALIGSLRQWCLDLKPSGLRRVVWVTGNPDSAKFYEKAGFVVTNYWLFYSGSMEL